jgi:hypothetical protein
MMTKDHHRRQSPDSERSQLVTGSLLASFVGQVFVQGNLQLLVKKLDTSSFMAGSTQGTDEISCQQNDTSLSHSHSPTSFKEESIKFRGLQVPLQGQKSPGIASLVHLSRTAGHECDTTQ